MVNKKSLANLKKEPGITKENAVEMQRKSADKRKENRTFRQIMEAKLAEKGRKSNIIEQVVKRAEEGDLAAFDRVRDVMDEQDDERINERPTLNLVIDKETAAVLKDIIG